MSLPTTPTFVLPYKRYATSSLVALAHSYLDNDGQSYRQTVCPGEAPPDYHYQSLASGDPSSCVSASIDDRLLRHSTVWRTLTWLGRQGVALGLAANRSSRTIPSRAAIALWAPWPRKSSAVRNARRCWSRHANCYRLSTSGKPCSPSLSSPVLQPEPASIDLC